MTEGTERRSHRYREGIFSAVSAGVFFVVIGVLFVITPNLFDEITTFFQDFHLVQVNSVTFPGVFLPAPSFPISHQVVYLAAEQFCIVWGVFQIVMLVVRFAARSPLDKKAETAGNLVFWLGAAFLISTFLIQPTTLTGFSGLTRWFAFWAAIIMLIGLSLIVRSIFLAAKPAKSTI